MSLNHKRKYLKYKLKYLQEKQKIMKGGVTDEEQDRDNLFADAIEGMNTMIQEQIDQLKIELQKLKKQFETHYHETKGIKH